MKRCFLIFPVAFLFCCSGCGVQKSQKKQIFNQNHKSSLLIKRSSLSLVRDSSVKNKKEKMPIVAQEEQKHVSKKYSVKQRIMEIEARLGDLPLPLMVKNISVFDDGRGCYVIVSKTGLLLTEIIHFYTQEMQQLGWTTIASFQQEELLFSFKKQKQSCIVSIRPPKQSWWSKKPTMLHLYLQV